MTKKQYKLLEIAFKRYTDVNTIECFNTIMKYYSSPFNNWEEFNSIDYKLAFKSRTRGCLRSYKICKLMPVYPDTPKGSVTLKYGRDEYHARLIDHFPLSDYGKSWCLTK